MDLSRAQIIELNPRTNFTFTSASLDLFEACPASGVFYGPKSKPTGAMWYGIFVHRFLEYVTTRGKDAAYKYIREKASSGGRSVTAAARCCEKIDVDKIPMGEAEVALAHDLQTGTVRRLFGPHDRARPWEAYGKADLLFHDADGVPHIADYKCGWLDADPNTIPQLLGLGASVRIDTGVPAVKLSIVGVESTGALHWRTIMADQPRLEHFEARMRRVNLRVLDDRQKFAEGVNPDFVPGPHCHQCHCQPVCPAIPSAQRV